MAEDSKPLFKCPNCGKNYRWKSQLAGRKTRCRDCSQTMRIRSKPGKPAHAIGPPPAPDASTYDLDLGEDSREAAVKAAGGKCPSCNTKLKRGAVICINCGFNLQEGKQIETAVGAGKGGASRAGGAEAGGPRRLHGGDDISQFAGLAAAGGNVELARELAGEVESIPSPFIELWLPLGLIILGIVIRMAHMLYLSGTAVEGLLAAAVSAAVEIVISVPVLFLALVVTAKLLQIDFGPLGKAVFKLMAVTLGPAAVGAVVAVVLGNPIVGMLVGGAVTLAAYWGLLLVLFDLEAVEALWVMIIIFVVTLLVVFASGYVKPLVFDLFPL